MITIRRENFTREEWDAAETAIDNHPYHTLHRTDFMPPLYPGLYARGTVENWVWAIRKEEIREAEINESPGRVVALAGAAAKLGRMVAGGLITRKTVKPEGAGERIEERAS